MAGLSREGSRRKDESREASCTTAHQLKACPILRADTIFQDLGLTYLKDDLKTNKLQLLKIQGVFLTGAPLKS